MGRLFILLSITSFLGITPAVSAELPGADVAGVWQYLEQNSAELNAARMESNAAE